MYDFRAHTDGINAWLAADMFVEVNGVAPVENIKPGTLLLMNADGRFEVMTETTVDLSNKHLVYFCNSWADSVSMYGNMMVSAIPLTKQFEADITFEADDESLADGIDVGPGDLLCITANQMAEAASANYVIGQIKTGTLTKELGGTVTIATWGGDFIVP